MRPNVFRVSKNKISMKKILTVKRSVFTTPLRDGSSYQIWWIFSPNFQEIILGVPKKVSFGELSICRLDFPPAMGSLSLEIVFGRFLQFLNRIKRFKVIFIGNFSQQHPILFMIFGLEMVPWEALNRAHYGGEICQYRHCRQQCKTFASGVNFSRNNAVYYINDSTKYVHVILISSLKLLTHY